MLNRSEASALLKEHIENKNLIKHCIATEAIMRALAKKLSKDEDLWGITGLLHDLDLEMTRETKEEHAKKAVDILKEYDFPKEALDAILAHNGEVLNIEPKTDFDHALICAETITGLIVATALVYPDKKLKSVKNKSVKKRMKEKWFAKNVDRDKINLCEKLGISLDDFIDVSVNAMTDISDELGL